jgi:hypothetical protein
MYHLILLLLTSQIFSATFLYATLAVSAGQPSLISDDADVVALVGTSKDLAKQINQKEVHWGVCYSSTSVINLCFLLTILPKQLNADQRGKMALVALLFMPLPEHTSPTNANFQFCIYSSVSLGTYCS